MGTVDIIIIIALAFAFYRGYGKGIINRLASFLGFFLAYNFTGSLFGKVHEYLITHDVLNPESSKYLTYGLTFVLIIILVKVLASVMVKLLKFLGINFVNKFAGGFVNILLWGAIISIIIYFSTDLKILSENLSNENGLVPFMNDLGSFLMKNFFK